MITIPKAKKWVDDELIKHLTHLQKVLTIADLGLSAKQSDVAKVKEIIQDRINRIARKHEIKLHLE